jgi:hypothetical protein
MHAMKRRWLLSLALMFATSFALPQESPAPIQTAQAEEKPQVEPGIVLPNAGSTKELLIAAALLGLVLLPISRAEDCDHSGCGGPAPATTTTGTR